MMASKLPFGRWPVLLCCVWLWLAACAPTARPATSEQPLTRPSATSAARLTPTPSVARPAASATPPPTPTVRPPWPTATRTATPTVTPEPTPLIVAVIGDFGSQEPGTLDVAALVHSWQPTLILTLGDNNYPDGSAETLPLNLAPYAADIAAGRFFPVLGNHDYLTGAGQPYFDFFVLPGNERYYDFVLGPAHFFALNSDWREPDGIGAASTQARWLQARLATSTADWHIVFFHAPALVSRADSVVPAMDWPFAAWGVDLVLSGHAHIYERLARDGIPYIVNGLGGHSIYNFDATPLPESRLRFNRDFGALRLTVTQARLAGAFISRAGLVVDTWQLDAADR